jgi:hypothetical protein
MQPDGWFCFMADSLHLEEYKNSHYSVRFLMGSHIMVSIG